MFELFLNLLILQALMGAFDTLYHHELKVGLARCVTARLELAIHALRAVLYAVVFIGIAWFEWRGAWVLVLIGIILIEVGLTLWDFIVEDRTRLLPNSERVTHTLLAINGGAAFALLATELPQWFAQATELYPVEYGWRAWFLTLAGIGVGLSGLRDGFAAWSVQRLDLKLDLDLGRHRRVLISGGTGFIGSALVHELLHKGHEITILTRDPHATAMQFAGRVRAISNTDELSAEIHFDTVINLAGAPVVGLPWTARRRRSIETSRYLTTQQLLNFVQRAQDRPAVWIQASAIGYYGTRSDLTVDETSPAGEGFAANLCSTWEQMSNELEVLGVRRVILRFGMVFGRSGGSLPMLLLSYRLWAGAVIGNGQQHLGWIHIEDLLRLIAYAIREQNVRGKINAVAPDVPTYAEFSRLTAHLLQRPVWFRIPGKFLRAILGEMSTLFVDGPQIVPRRLQQLVFEYRFPDLRSALMDLS